MEQRIYIEEPVIEEEDIFDLEEDAAIISNTNTCNSGCGSDKEEDSEVV